MSQLNRTNSISSINLNESLDGSVESARFEARRDQAPARRSSFRSAREDDNPYLRKQGNSSDTLNVPKVARDQSVLSNRSNRSPFSLAKKNPFQYVFVRNNHINPTNHSHDSIRISKIEPSVTRGIAPLPNYGIQVTDEEESPVEYYNDETSEEILE